MKALLNLISIGALIGTTDLAPAQQCPAAMETMSQPGTAGPVVSGFLWKGRQFFLDVRNHSAVFGT